MCVCVCAKVIIRRIVKFIAPAADLVNARLGEQHENIFVLDV